jgi:hypothetical protein
MYKVKDLSAEDIYHLIQKSLLKENELAWVVEKKDVLKAFNEVREKKGRTKLLANFKKYSVPKLSVITYGEVKEREEEVLVEKTNE